MTKTVVYKRITTLFITLLVGVAASLIFLPQLTAAQTESRSVELRAGTEASATPTESREIEIRGSAEAEMEVEATAVDTNVCDGATCPDGSCVATQDECPVAATISRPTSCPTDSLVRCPDGSCVASRDLCVVPERPTPAPAEVEVRNTPPVATPPRQAEPDFRDTDSDGDAIPDTVEAGDRDRRVVPLFRDNDDDNDDVPTASEERPVTPAALREAIRGDVEENDETGERRLSRVAISAREVRGWSSDDRDAFTELFASVASNTPEHVSFRITERLMADEQIAEIEIEDGTLRMRHQVQMRLFGLIPMSRESEVWCWGDNSRAASEVCRDEDIEIDYPWYSFLATKPNRDTIRSTAREMMALFHAE